MPGFNQTGPMGQGPRTGRGMGKCKGTPVEDTTIDNNTPATGAGQGQGGQGLGRGQGQGRGQGRGQSQGQGRDQGVQAQGLGPGMGKSQQGNRQNRFGAVANDSE